LIEAQEREMAVGARLDTSQRREFGGSSRTAVLSLDQNFEDGVSLHDAIPAAA
jgi:hypothetical protein